MAGSGYEGSFRERLASLSRAEIAGLVVVAVVTLGGAGLWYVRSLPAPVAVAADGAAGPVATPVPGPSPAAGDAIFVHVVGRIRDPGVFEFAPGSRVVDALEAAGGPRRDAALGALNLAAPLVDGQQVVVPRRGAQGGGTSGGTDGSGLVNVNTADAAQLEELPGIGPVLAEAIVRYRTENGPFTSVDQLEDVSGIGPATLEEIREHVTI